MLLVSVAGLMACSSPAEELLEEMNHPTKLVHDKISVWNEAEGKYQQVDVNEWPVVIDDWEDGGSEKISLGRK